MLNGLKLLNWLKMLKWLKLLDWLTLLVGLTATTASPMAGYGRGHYFYLKVAM